MTRKFLNSEFWQRYRGDAAALASIVLFFGAFFPQALLGRKYVFVGDGFFYSYPLRTVAWRMIRHAELPLWTPHILSGYPLLSMAQLGLGYPLTWGYLFLPGHVAEQIYVLAPFILAPAFTYAYLRTLKRSPLASLMGALVFGYGGMMASPLANNGLLTNACMWLPLVLIALERARHSSFLPALLLGTFAYTMSVLTGVGQGFVYVGLLAFVYAIFLVVMKDSRQENLRARLSSIQSWRPLFVAIGMSAIAAGVAAFQILETSRAVPLSVRRTLSYPIFTQGSFPPPLLWKSFTTPLLYVIDMTAYVAPLACALALVAVVMHVRARQQDSRIFFWLAVAFLGLVLMLGAFTPIYRIVFHLPVLNRFRVPSRHTFEWTFAVGVLAAYGWDALAPTVRKLRARRSSFTFRLSTALAMLAAAVVAGVLWWLKALTLHAGSLGHPAAVYRSWKSLFVLLCIGALWRASLIVQPRWRFGLLLATVLVLCYVEPSLLVARWWNGVDAARFATVSPATRFLQQYPPEQNRIYTRVDLMTEQYGAPPRFDGQNMSAIYGLHNVAGYEPLILERYSRALGGVGLDSVRTFDQGEPDPSLLRARSHVLDILNTAYVVSYDNLETALRPSSQSAGAEVIGELPPQAVKTVLAPPAEAEALFLITSLSNSTFVADGQAVARLRIYTEDGQIFDRELQAGRDTAEWAHERPDVRALMKHKLATIYDTTPVGGAHGYQAHRYQALLPFDKSTRLTRVEITNVAQSARLGIYSMSLVEAQTHRNVPFTAPYSDAWQPVYEQDQTLILRNTRALPRAWLVSEAESVNSEEALHRIRGEGTQEFDPRRTVLLEVKPEELPQLPGGNTPAESTAQIKSYEPNRLSIETNALAATVVVVSEIFYPGWEATVDGKPAEIKIADYLLRGVALPAGKHSVEMRYTATGARKGLPVSIVTLCVLVGLTIYARKRRGAKNKRAAKA